MRRDNRLADLKTKYSSKIIDDMLPKMSELFPKDTQADTSERNYQGEGAGNEGPTPRYTDNPRSWTIEDQMEQEGLGLFGYIEPGNTYEVEVDGIMKNFYWNEGPLSYNRWDGSKGNYLDKRDDGGVPDSKIKPKVEIKDAKSLEQLIINDLLDLDRSVLESQEAFMEMKKKQRIEREGGDFDWNTDYRGESSEIREKYKNMRNKRGLLDLFQWQRK